MTLALFGITNDGLNLAVNLLILFLIVLWLALVAWTFLDARRRIQDPVLIACATAASLFPFVGTVVYSILRPPEFLADKRERELEIRASELRVRQLEESSCPNCEHPVERTFLRCPNCRARIKDPCESCGKPIDPRWSICPYCETPQRRAAPPERAAVEAPLEGAGLVRAPRSQPAKPRRSSRSGSRTGSGPRSSSPAQPSADGELQHAAAALDAGASALEQPPPQRSRPEPPAATSVPAVEPAADKLPRRWLSLAHPDPDQARRVRARAHRRDPGPLRAQGPADHRRCGCCTRDEEIANAHYAEHTEKPFFGELVSFITGGPLVAAVLEGHEAVRAARQLIGATNPIEAAPGSIRGDYGLEVTFNLVHGSDSDESAEREIGIWFG